MRNTDTGGVPLLKAEYNYGHTDGTDSDVDDLWSEQDFVHLVASNYTKQSNMQKRLRGILIVCGCSLLILAIGLGIGYGIAHSRKTNGVVLSGVLEQIIQDGDQSIQMKLMDGIDTEKIRNNLRDLTKHPHLAGTAQEKKLAEQIRDSWLEYGFDSAKLQPYDVLLSYPNKTHPNKVVLYNEKNQAIFTSQLAEKVLSPDQNQSNVVPPFNAYSVAGNPKGQLVYVNFGRYEDFEWLKKNTQIDLTGNICLARYGKIFRGDKVRFGHKYGCLGMILYSDPINYAPDTKGNVFPKTWWLPDTGVQRGTLFREKGDPQTPGYPSIPTAYRISENMIKVPKIPSHPIGYGDAKHLLEQLDGDIAPNDWQGGIPGVTYKLGPKFKNPKWQVQLDVYNKNTVKTVYNVIGTIEGSLEPDRYVLLGNHRDAWVFGAVDPSSGTAAMMELSRAFGGLVKENWRPRRSLVFCSWGAEEYGLLGSTEWVEHFSKNLGERAVAYLNVDISVEGNFTMRGKSTPLMYKAIYEATKLVPNPNDTEIAAGRKSVYDTWLNAFPTKDKTVPKIKLLGSGSDYAPFIGSIGVTSMDVRYSYDEVRMKLSSYPMYHSVYETFSLINDIMDPTFKYHQAVTRVWGEVARNLADSYVLPFDVRDYGNAIKTYVSAFDKTYGALVEKQGIKLDDLNKAADTFKSKCDEFHTTLQKIDRNNPLEVRKINDQMVQLERAFIDPGGLPNRPYQRHILCAPSETDNYSGASFPGLVDALFEIEKDPNPKPRWEAFKKHLSVVIYTILSAASTLTDAGNF